MYRHGTDIWSCIWACTPTITELPSTARRRMLRGISALFALLALCMGVVLLYCAYTGTVLGADVGGMVIGVQDGCLYGGVHYNITGMVALGCMMLSLVSMNAERNPLFKAVGLAAAGMMTVVVVLTQSRTARYAMLVALAVGCYGTLAARFWDRKAIVRHGVAVLCACLVLAGGYAGASKLTDLALEHYMRLNEGTQGALQSVVSSAAAEEVADAEVAESVATPGDETPAPEQPRQDDSQGVDEAAETGDAQATAAPGACRWRRRRQCLWRHGKLWTHRFLAERRSGSVWPDYGRRIRSICSLATAWAARAARL